MDKDKDGTKTSARRRDFLKLAGFGAAAGAAAVTGARQADAEAPAQADRKGYQETPHVKQYYRTARF